MKIKSLHIKNFKSIIDLTINEPNPFTVFVGPNGSGKSNIFEALEFTTFTSEKYNIALSLFGGENNILPKKTPNEVQFHCTVYFEDNKFSVVRFTGKPFGTHYFGRTYEEHLFNDGPIDNSFFISNFCKIFVNSKKENRQNLTDDIKLNINTNNLEKVLKRLLENKEKREEISEWLDLFLPEFDRIEVQKSEFSSNENLLIYQKHYDRPFNKELISDGTYNIIALLTAVYQSDEPQFLCIEEPENGLHPKVIKQLVNFFRDACEERGHYIWLNTHSQTLVSMLEEKEMIIVDKKNGETQIKQFKEGDFYGMPADDALLTNALGGGLPW